MRLDFDIDTRAFEEEVLRVLDKARPELQKALVGVAQQVQDVWVKAVSGGSMLPGMTKTVNNDAYASAISDPGVILQVGDEVQIAPKRELEKIKAVEDGQPSWDMKPRLLARKSAKSGRSGAIFVDVPIIDRKQSGGPIRANMAKPNKFRRVSENSKPGTWIHPAIPPNPVVAAVQKEADKLVMDATLKVVEKYL